MAWISDVLQLVPWLASLIGRNQDGRARLSFHRASSSSTTGRTPVPREEVHLNVNNSRPAEAKLLHGRYKASWTDGQWVTLEALPAIIPGNRIAEHIPGINVPPAYAEKESRSPQFAVWFDVELTHMNPDKSTCVTSVRQRWPAEQDSPYQWLIEQPQRERVIRTRPLKRLLSWVLVAICILALSVGGTVHLTKAHRVRTELARMSLGDRALISRILSYDEKGGLSRAEYFGKAEKNIDVRESTLYRLETMDPYVYKRQTSMLRELLNLENDHIRSSMALETALMESEGADEVFWDAFRRCKGAGFPNNATSQYIYREQFLPASDRAERAREAIIECSKAVAKTLDNWIRKESLYRPMLSRAIGDRNLVPRLTALRLRIGKYADRSDRSRNQLQHTE